MKKALAILMTLALVGSLSFAEVKIGAWGRGLFVPYYNDGDSDATSFNTVSWGGPNARVGISIIGSSDNAGFEIDMNMDGGSAGISDQNKLWVKPTDKVKAEIGVVFDDTLRGNACYGTWNWLRTSTMGEDSIFPRINTGNGGFVLSATPVEALYVVASVNNIKNSVLQEDLLKNAQYAVGYTIANIGTIRAQYIGVYTPATTTAEEVDSSLINAAFKFTGMENLYVDAGIFIPTNADDFGKYDMMFNAFASYKVNAATLYASAGFATDCADYENLDGELAMDLGFGVDYALAGGVTLSADIRNQNSAGTYVYGNGVTYSIAGTNVQGPIEDGMTSFFVGVDKGFSNGKIGIGFQYATTAFNNWKNGGWATETAGDQGDNGTYAIPVKLEYWF
jgi:hypothetical protein